MSEEAVATHSVEDMIQNALDQDFNKANKTFGDIMTIKMNDLLDQEQVKLADQIYNGVEPDEEELDPSEEDQLELDLEGEGEPESDESYDEEDDEVEDYSEDDDDITDEELDDMIDNLSDEEFEELRAEAEAEVEDEENSSQ